MIGFFHKAELTITFSLAEQAKWTAALAAAKIPYKIKTIYRNSPAAMGSSRVLGSYGQDLDLAREYIIYVDQKDLPRAKALLAGIN